MSKLVFKPKYFILSIILFIAELSIELFAHDDFIRPYFGDYLIVILLYCLIRTFCRMKTLTACILVLIFSFAIEFSQYFQLLSIFDLQDSYWAKLIFGSSFSQWDLLAYLLGIISVYILENKFFDKK